MSSLSAVAEEDEWRIRCYRLLARLFYAVPDQDLLQQLSSIESSAQQQNALNQAWQALANAARLVNNTQLEQEFNALFIGFTRGEILPYASYYLSGFLMEKPLIGIRDDLLRAGIIRQSHVHEPEDHIAALCESMSILIEDDGVQQTDQQWAFLNTHLLSWCQRLFTDLHSAESANFYQAVAQYGTAFLAVETQLAQLQQ
jgi:TorA maturation chaperone TorD